MSKITDYLFNARNKRTAKKVHYQHFTPNYKDAQKIGILFYLTSEQYAETLNQFVKTLKNEGKVVKLLTFFDQQGSSPYDFQFDFFNKKEISTLGKIKSLTVENFIQEDFDYLYCINIEHFPPFDSIMIQSKAKCRFGKYFEEPERQCFEMMIFLKEGEKEDKLIEQMWHYSQEIKHN